MRCREKEASLTVKSTPAACCDLCGSRFVFGHGRYDGKHLGYYKLTLCDGCYSGNWDGFAPHLEPKMLEHLRKNSIPTPPRNAKGLIPRDL